MAALFDLLARGYDLAVVDISPLASAGRAPALVALVARPTATRAERRRR